MKQINMKQRNNAMQLAFEYNYYNIVTVGEVANHFMKGDPTIGFLVKTFDKERSNGLVSIALIGLIEQACRLKRRGTVRS